MLANAAYGRGQHSTLRMLLQFLAVSVFVLTVCWVRRYTGFPAGNSERRFPVFTDVTEKAGLNFKIICGDQVTEYLIDVNGEGAAFFDYDNDGYQDIYLVNGSSRKCQKEGRLPHDYLLHNNGNGTFTDVTEKAHLGDTRLDQATLGIGHRRDRASAVMGCLRYSPSAL